METKPATYVRFVVGGDDENFSLLDGIFSVATRLRDAGNFQEYEIEWLTQIFEWFNENLPSPPFNGRFERLTWSRDAVCWLRSDAKSMLVKMWDIVALLKEKGENVRFVQTSNPGRIVYSDEFQIVTEARVKWRP